MKRGERLNLRIEERLKKKIQAYCDKKHVSVSDFVTQYFVQVLEEEEKKRKAILDAEQI